MIKFYVKKNDFTFLVDVREPISELLQAIVKITKGFRHTKSGKKKK